jgi:hypothetical protein
LIIFILRPGVSILLFNGGFDKMPGRSRSLLKIIMPAFAVEKYH